ncbi:hypothetical protein [Vreelandella arcis]|uniref:Uncharacterized protein n=1 Tax=Vreelandella arcis TaxID=416873 RepID=A0A1H0JEZ2_9GAMM|nr:hypothetical protein [Halomonas arcis]SDO42093.1 hypothetical protein SAMN04487951_12621 [Halomonas arcis]
MRDQQNFSEATEALISAFERQPHLKPKTISTLPERQAFIDAAELSGFTGANMELDTRFSERKPKWIAKASTESLKRWVHTLLRSERWNSECPNEILEALRGGQMQALAVRLSELDPENEIDEWLCQEKDQPSLIQSGGGYLVRVLQAIDGFYATYGEWPTSLRMPEDALAVLVTYHLSPQGFFRLQSRLSIGSERDTDLIAISGKWEFNYSQQGWNATNDGPVTAREWLGFPEC